MKEEELNKAAEEFGNTLPEHSMFYPSAMIKAFKTGAKWAMEQFQKVEPTNKTGWMTGDKEYVDELHFHDNALEEPFEIYIRKKDE